MTQSRAPLHPSPPEDAPDVDPGQKQDQAQGKDDRLQLSQGPAHCEAESAREGHRQGADAGGTVEEELVPTEEEAGGFSVGLLEKGVEASGARQHGGQFRKAECAQDTDGAAQ